MLPPCEEHQMRKAPTVSPDVRSRPNLLHTAVRARLVAPLRPDKYARMATALRGGVDATVGIRLAAIRRPAGTAVIDELGSMTWKALDDSADALASAIQTLGGAGRPPDVVGILCRNHRGFVQAVAATARIGADTVLLNTSFAGPQLADVVAREGIQVLIHDDEFSATVTELDRLPHHPTRILAWADDPTDQPTINRLIASCLGRKPERSARRGRIVLLTSGTTGTPKGAARPSGGSAADLMTLLRTIPWRAEEPVVVAAPMFHAWGFSQMLLAATMTCTIVVARRFDPEDTLRLVAEHGASGLVVVPVMLERIVDLPDGIKNTFDIGSLRFVSASGSRMRADAVTRFMDEFGDVIYNSYNATEAGMISIATPADLRSETDTAGRPVDGTDVRILDDGHAPVAPGAVGQIFVRNRSMFDGYTSGDSDIYLDGYIASGDLGRVDEAGRLYVVGRIDDMIVSGGENVHPLETERTLTDHPAVREAAVVGVDDQDFGERLVAYVVRQPGATVDEDELKRHVKDRLASYKVPRDITFMSQLPRNAAGKVSNQALRAATDGN